LGAGGIDEVVALSGYLRASYIARVVLFSLIPKAFTLTSEISRYPSNDGNDLIFIGTYLPGQVIEVFFYQLANEDCRSSGYGQWYRGSTYFSFVGHGFFVPGCHSLEQHPCVYNRMGNGKEFEYRALKDLFAY